jgi:uncharacterized protein YjiK
LSGKIHVTADTRHIEFHCIGISLFRIGNLGMDGVGYDEIDQGLGISQSMRMVANTGLPN